MKMKTWKGRQGRCPHPPRRSGTFLREECVSGVSEECTSMEDVYVFEGCALVALSPAHVSGVPPQVQVRGYSPQRMARVVSA